MGIFSSLADSEILYMIMQAEREGFDGAIIACFHDPTLWSARQAVDIPVAAFGESSMLLAAVWGVSSGSSARRPWECRISKTGWHCTG